MSEFEQVLGQIMASMPSGSAVTLPIDWLRSLRQGERPAETTAVVDMTVEAAALLMHRKPSTVRGWCSSGRVKAYRLNNRDWRITVVALREFQDQQFAQAQNVGKRRTRVELGAWRDERSH